MIAEALRRQAGAAAAEAAEQEAARRAAEVRELLEFGGHGALRNKDFPRARGLAERALALDPDSNAPKELIAQDRHRRRALGDRARRRDRRPRAPTGRPRRDRGSGARQRTAGSTRAVSTGAATSFTTGPRRP